jgi:hypothetical protein
MTHNYIVTQNQQITSESLSNVLTKSANSLLRGEL